MTNNQEQAVQTLETAHEELKTSKEEIQAAINALAHSNSDLHALSAETFEQLLPMADAIAQCIARKRSEQELQDREARLRRVIDNALCFIGILDTRGILQEANEAALLAGGLNREDVFGKPFWECYWWSHDEQTVNDLKAAIATALQGEVVRYDVEVRMAGDSRLMIDFMLAPVKDADGKIAYLIPSGVDISERKFAERQLQQRVQQLNLALDTGRMGIWEWDFLSDHVRWSPQLYDMFGYTEATLKPTKAGFLSTVHPDDHEKLESLIASAFVGDCAEHDVEFRVMRGDTGEWVWTHCRGTTVRNSHGQPLSIQSVSIDVTARKRRELSVVFLAELQNKLAMLTSAPDIMSVASTDLCEFLQLSRFLIVEIDETAEIANVIFDQHSHELMDLRGSYQMVEFASDEERRLLALGQPMIVNDTTDPARGQKSIENFAKLNVGAIINSPGTRNQRLEFMLSAVKPTAHTWQDDEVQMLRELSTFLRLKLERVRAEEALRESESRFRDLADNMSQFAWVTDPAGAISWYNKRWFDYTGTTFEDMQGWGWKAVHHPDHIERVVKRWQGCLSAGEVWEDTFPLRSKHGEYRWFLSLARPIRDEDGSILRWFGTNTDITDAKEQEQRTRESEERLRSAAQAAGFGTIHVDLLTRTATVSDELWRIIGLPGNETDKVAADSMPSCIHRDDHKAFACFVRELTKLKDGSTCSIDLRILCPDSEIRWVRLQAKPVYSGSGSSRGPTQIIGTVLDITKQREFEHSLSEARALAEAANESKSVFLANMSHEIRTPMTAILGYTDLVADRVQDDEAASDLRTIRRNGYFLLDIINDILDLSKIEAGMLDVSCERFAPDQLVEDVRSIMEVRAIENHLTLDVEYRGLIPAQIESDAKRLKQILINLVGNAIKFTKQGSVHVVVSYRDQSLQFDIIDTGIGMTKHQQKRLFQPFSQGDHTVNREFGGTGLGLAISQRIATLLGGNISAKSEPNQGSTFTVTIATGDVTDLKLIQPIRVGEPNPVEQPGITVELACRILVVDDRRDIRFLSRRILTEAGATVVEAEDGEIALHRVIQALAGTPFDLIILDMQMPKLDGYETAKQLRQLGFTGPIIALTADAMHGDMSRCLASGCNDYLSKPIDKIALLRMVSDYVGRMRGDLNTSR